MEGCENLVDVSTFRCLIEYVCIQVRLGGGFCSRSRYPNCDYVPLSRYGPLLGGKFA